MEKTCSLTHLEGGFWPCPPNIGFSMIWLVLPPVWEMDSGNSHFLKPGPGNWHSTSVIYCQSSDHQALGAQVLRRELSAAWEILKIGAEGFRRRAVLPLSQPLELGFTELPNVTVNGWYQAGNMLVSALSSIVSRSCKPWGLQGLADSVNDWRGWGAGQREGERHGELESSVTVEEKTPANSSQLIPSL